MEHESLRYPSWCLTRLLENIIGTEEQVALRRKLISMTTYVRDVFPKYKLLFSGSRAEGFVFKSSDIDVMHIDRYAVAVESSQYLRSDDYSKTVLLIRRDMCNPGFVILQLMNRTNDNNILKSLVEYKNCSVVSSILYRDQHRMTELHQEGHGPCNTFHFQYDTDIAHCFACNKWPIEAYEFIHRQRQHGWPSKALVDEIVSGGCHLVPIGDKDHDLSYIQWRLSFSAAEKVLIHSFNHTQFLVYGLMKIFLKQVINKVMSVEDLCSYFLKTALFYSIESTPLSFWKEDLIIPCFWFCLNKVIKWVECGHCPNFFVPGNNMFRGKVCGENRYRLLAVLKKLQCSGWNCVCLCEDLHLFEYFLNHQESVFHVGLILSEANIERKVDLTTFTLMPTVYGISDTHSNLSRSLILMCCSRSHHEHDISTFYPPSVLSSVGQFCFCSEVGRNNKARYKSVRKCNVLLQKTADRDVSVGPLTLATYCYTTGQYNEVVQICQRVISQWKPYVLYGQTTQELVTESYERHVCGRGINIVDKARKAFASVMIIYPSYKSFYPAELDDDIAATSPFPLLIPPLPYTEFLLCLCHIKLGNIHNSLAALRDLQLLIQDEVQGHGRYPLIENLLAICFDKVGDVGSAIDLCLLSRKLKPQRNGAEKLLEKLLHKNY